MSRSAVRAQARSTRVLKALSQDCPFRGLHPPAARLCTLALPRQPARLGRRVACPAACVALGRVGAAMPAMPLNGHESHHVASEGNCPKAEDSDGVARWALGRLRSKSPEEARTPENSKRLCEAIDKEVSLGLLIPRLLKVRRLRATTHALTPKSTLHLTKLVRRRCPRILSTSPPSTCCSLRWPLSRAAGSKRGLGLAWFPGHQAERPAAATSRGPAAPDCGALAPTLPTPTHSEQARELHRVGQTGRRRRLRRVRDGQWQVRCPAATGARH